MVFPVGPYFYLFFLPQGISDSVNTILVLMSYFRDAFMWLPYLLM